MRPSGTPAAHPSCHPHARAPPSTVPPALTSSLFTQMGVGINWNRLDDVSSTSQTFDNSNSLSWLLWLAGADRFTGGGGDAPAIDAEGVRHLFTSLDFLGVSAYAPYSGAGMPMDELGNAAFTFADSIKSFGVDLASLISSGLELHYAEVGVI